MPLTVAVDVPPRDREVLKSWLRAPSLRAGLAQRARIVLLAADGVAVKDIVERVGVANPTVIEPHQGVGEVKPTLRRSDGDGAQVNRLWRILRDRQRGVSSLV